MIAHRKTLATTIAAGALAMTACTSTAVSDQQAHVEQLQDLEAAQQAQLLNEQFDATGQRIQPDSPAEATALDAEYADSEAWKAERVQQYRDNYTTTYSIVCADYLDSYAGCGPEDPHSHIDTITAPEIGQLHVTLDDGAWSSGFAAEFPAEYVATGMMHFIAYDALDVERITVELPDGTSYTEKWNPLEYEGIYEQPVIPATS